MRDEDVFEVSNVRSTAGRREAANNIRGVHDPYVIIGCGAAAIVNHTTLRQTSWGQQRVGNRQIIHVGFQDPWSHYNLHGMGQYPQLLGMPGYVNRPQLDTNGGPEDTTGPRHSTLFGRNTRQETARIEQHLGGAGLNIYPYAVAWIQRRGDALPAPVRRALVAEGLDGAALDAKIAETHPPGWGPYRLLLVSSRATLHWGYAAFIDICTGAGKPRVLEQNKFQNPADYDAMRTRIWEPPEYWTQAQKDRAVMTGTEGLYTATNWNIGTRYCVMGGGGVGVNMVERADETNKYTDWLATQTLHASFPIERNDILLRHPHQWAAGAITVAGQRMDYGGLGDGRNYQDAILDPARREWRLGQGTDVSLVTLNNGRVDLTFVPAQARGRNPGPVTYQDTRDPALNGQVIPSRVRDWWEQETDLAAGTFPFSAMAQNGTPGQARTPQAITGAPATYDRLIRAAGQDNNAVGQALSIAGHLQFTPILAPSDNRMVGLQAEQGAIRVLGSAGTGNPALLQNAADPAAARMREFHNSLPVQGQIFFVGFVFSGLNVATANHYFDTAAFKKQNAGAQAANTPVEANDNVNTMSIAELTDAFGGDNSLARKVARVRCVAQSGFLSVAELVAALQQLEELDQMEHALSFLTQGWQAEIEALQLDVINRGDSTEISGAVRAKLACWVAYARRRNDADYAAKNELVVHIEALHRKWQTSPPPAVKRRTLPLAAGWQATLANANLRVDYRPADPYVF